MMRHHFAASSFAMLICIAAVVSVGEAAFTDTFEADALGSPPANWTITGTNGTTRTANVASEAGPNRFLARRDSENPGMISAERSLGAGDSRGFVGFDVRLNQGIDAEFNVRLFARSTSPSLPSVLEPIALQWFPGAYNPAAPHIFRTRGNNQYPTITGNFPIGSWQTIGIWFNASSGPFGQYSVTWNGNDTKADFLNQGPTGLIIDRILITLQGPQGTTESIDIDNVVFFPEPSGALATLGIAALGFARRRNNGRNAEHHVWR